MMRSNTSRIVFGLVILSATLALFAGAAFADIARVRVDLRKEAPELGTGKDFRRILSGGATWEGGAGERYQHKIYDLGMESVRVINIEKCGFEKIGNFWKFTPGNRFTKSLRFAREHRLTPHIILGLWVPDSLMYGVGTDRRWGPKNWDDYDAFVEAMLLHAITPKGFNFDSIIIEVGNEWHNPKLNWISRKKLTEKLHPEGYKHYMQLYKRMAGVVQKLRKKYPEKDIRFGGTGFNQHPMGFSVDDPRNWTAQFVRDVQKEKLLCDHLGIHYYGSAATGKVLKKRVKALQKVMAEVGRDIPIWFTEWGVNAYNREDSLNHTAVAGGFVPAFTEFCARLGIERNVFLLPVRRPGKHIPYYIDEDGQGGHGFTALTWMYELGDTRLHHASNNESVGCIAARKGDMLDVVLWNLDWMNYQLDRSRLGDLQRSAPGLVDVFFTPREGEKLELLSVDVQQKSLSPTSKQFPTLEKAKRSDEYLLKAFRLPFSSYVRLRFRSNMP